MPILKGNNFKNLEVKMKTKEYDLNVGKKCMYVENCKKKQDKRASLGLELYL